MLLGTLGASLLGKLEREYTELEKVNEFLIPPHPLTNFEIHKYYENEPRFNGDNLPKKRIGHV